MIASACKRGSRRPYTHIERAQVIYHSEANLASAQLRFYRFMPHHSSFLHALPELSSNSRIDSVRSTSSILRNARIDVYKLVFQMVEKTRPEKRCIRLSKGAYNQFRHLALLSNITYRRRTTAPKRNFLSALSPRTITRVLPNKETCENFEIRRSSLNHGRQMTRFANFVTLIISAFTVVPGILAANNVRLPVAYRGTKGWIGVEQGSSESSFTFDFSSLATNATDISWIILQTPFIYGDQNCDDLVRRRANNGTLASGTLKVQKDAVRGSWSGSMIVKMSVSSLQARSIVLTQGTDKNRQALVCANILSDDILVFESRFYGPQVVGDVYFFLDTTTKMLKLYSRLSNGNNLEPAVNWTLKVTTLTRDS